MPETLLARKFADAIGAPFADAFRYQYAISEKTLDLPEFDHVQFGTFNIYHSPTLPVTRVEARDGTHIGYILGFAVTSGGHLLEGAARFDLDQSQPDAMAVVESCVRGLSGRYVVCISLNTQSRNETRLYVDPLGALSALYDPRSRICASSLLLALNRDIDPHVQFKIPQAVHDFPEISALLPEGPSDNDLKTPCFGQSFDAHVRQVLTNHSLDLTDFTTNRNMLPPPPDGYMDPNDAAELILNRMTKTLSALQPSRTGYLAISGGQDSRMLMAAAPRGFGDRMTYYSYSDNWITGVDLRLAQVLADCAREAFLGQAEPNTESGTFFDDPDDAVYFQKRCAVSSGLRITGDAWWSRGYFKELTPGALWLRGNALEIVTARLWTPTVDAPLRKGLRHALRRIGLDSRDPEIYSDMRQQLITWLDTLPEDWRGRFHDFWYQELYLSHSQSNFLGFNELAYFPPASDHAILQAARSVDPALRRADVLYDAIIKAGRPEFANIPTTGVITRDIKKTGLDLESVMALHM